MLKYNGIFIYLLFTITVAQDAAILNSGNSFHNNRINITLAQADFEYDLEGINNPVDVKLKKNDDSKIIDNKFKHITTFDLQMKGDKKKHEKLFDFVTDSIEILNKYNDSDINKLHVSKPPDVKESRVVENPKPKSNAIGNSVDKKKGIKYKNKQKERKREHEYKTAEHKLIPSYGLRNVKQTVDFDLPLSRDATESTIRPSHIRKTSQMFKYKMNLNFDKKIVREPNLNLKNPEFQVNFPAYPVKEMARNNRPNGQSLVDVPTFNHKNLINVRRMFDTGYIVNQENRVSGFLPIHTANTYKRTNNTQGRRLFPQMNADAKAAIIGLKSDSEANKIYKNTIVKMKTDNNAKSSTSLIVDPNVKKPQRKEVFVNLKFNFDTIKKIFSFPFDTISNAMKKNVNKTKQKRSTVTFKNKTKQLRNTNETKNNQNKTKEDSKNINTSKIKPNINNDSNGNDNNNNKNLYRVSLKDTYHDHIENGSVHKNIDTTKFKLIPEIKNGSNVILSNQLTKLYSVDKTPPVITDIYQSGVRKQYNDIDNTADIQTFINTKIDVQTIKTDKPQIEYYPTTAEIQVADENHVETKSEEEKILRKFVPKYFYQEGSGFGARELPGYIFELQNYKKTKNVPIEVKNMTEIVQQDDIADKIVTSGIFRFTTSIDRFHYLRQLMNRINL